jgi:hypothetical protein
MALYVRLATTPGAVLSRVRQAVQDIDRSLPLFEIHTLAEEMGAVLIRDRLIATLSTVFSALALLLACVGLYGFCVSGHSAPRGSKSHGARCQSR